MKHDADRKKGASRREKTAPLFSVSPSASERSLTSFIHSFFLRGGNKNEDCIRTSDN